MTGDETKAVLCVVEDGCDKKQHLDTPIKEIKHTTNSRLAFLLLYF